MPVKRNTKAITEMRKKDSDTAYEDIIEAIKTLKKAGKPINKSSVAKQAGCSRTTVYKHSDIVEQIEGIEARAKNKKTDKDGDLPKVKEERNDRIKMQYNRIKQLERDLNMAMIQLVAMEDLRRENAKKDNNIQRLTKQKNDLEKKILLSSASKHKESKTAKVVDIKSKSEPCQ